MSGGVELLAPAGNFETALAAFEAGADAVYCGLTEFSARAFADNFTLDDLKNLLRYARGSGAARGSGETSSSSDSRISSDSRRSRGKVYVTFNTVIDEDNLESAIEQLARLDEVHPDALIVQDIGVARICRKHFPGLELHASTQLVAHNLEGVLAMKELGFKRVVLARELSLEEIASIAKRCGDMELEVFVHGALCYSISGLCLFGAMEKGRSGNRGKCPYCCREGRSKSEKGKSADVVYPFSMKDLRLGEDVRKLADAGVASLKIEGRMKSALYVASVTRYYREILGSNRELSTAVGATAGGSTAVDRRRRLSVADLETVFSRRTTKLYFDGRPSDNRTIEQSNNPNNSPVDSESLGHLGAEIGVVKRITKDREGLSWLRFHTARGLEKHDGLQFEAMVDGKHVGMGVVEMRQAISRRPVFEVNAGVDVEVLLGNYRITESPNYRNDAERPVDLAKVLRPGMKVYCSMSNAVKRMFPAPSFRPSDYPGGVEIDVEVMLSPKSIAVECSRKPSASIGCFRLPSAKIGCNRGLSASIDCDLQPAKNPEKTFEGVKKAFSKLGETDYRLGKLKLNDPEKLFAPMSVLNDLRRDLVEQLDEERERTRREKVSSAIADDSAGGDLSSEQRGIGATGQVKRVKIRAGQNVPAGEWDEVVIAVNAVTEDPLQHQSNNRTIEQSRVRLALPVYTAEPEFNRLRSAVKRFLRAGYGKWEASDLATLRMLKALGVTDITADWTLYAFNSRALAELSEMGVKRFVASPENGRENLQYLAESGYDVEFLTQQSTPLFVSLTEPAAKPSELAVFRRDGLWVTTKPVPRTFETPGGVSVRTDLSWDPE